jgi:hypothetical protein
MGGASKHEGKEEEEGQKKEKDEEVKRWRVVLVVAD